MIKNTLGGIIKALDNVQYLRERLGNKGLFRSVSPDYALIEHFSSGGGEILDLSHNNYSGESTNFDNEVLSSKEKSVRMAVSLQSEVFRLNDMSPNKMASEKIKKLLDADSIYFTTSGYMANLAVLRFLNDFDVPLYMDSQTHESFGVSANTFMGEKLSKLNRWIKTKHYEFKNTEKINDIKYLSDLGDELIKISGKINIIRIKHNSVESLLKYYDKYGAGIIILEGVYSVTGSILDIDFAKKAYELGFLIILDESHSIGGVVSKSFSYAEKLRDNRVYVDIVTSSLSKAIGERGGFIAIMPHFIEKVSDYFLSEVIEDSSKLDKSHIIENIRDAVQLSGPLTFTNALDSTGLCEKLSVLEKNNFLSDLKIKSKYILKTLRQNNINIESDSPIIFVETRDNDNGKSEEIARKMRDWFISEKGIIGSLYLYPATDIGKAGVRFIINNDMKYSDIERFIKAVVQASEIFL